MPIFNHDFISFFSELAENNTRTWFSSQRKRYESSVKVPFKTFISSILPEIQLLDPEIDLRSNEAIFRVNRDLRFSENKTPYRTHMAAGFTKGGKKSQFAGYFLHFGPKNIFIGGGVPFPEKETLKKIRIEIACNKEAFNDILNNPEFTSLYGIMLGENENIAPKGFAEIYDDQPLIANKQFYYGAVYKSEDWLLNDQLGEFVIKHFKAGKAINHFLKRAINKYTQPVTTQNELHDMLLQS